MALSLVADTDEEEDAEAEAELFRHPLRPFMRSAAPALTETTGWGWRGWEAWWLLPLLLLWEDEMFMEQSGVRGKLSWYEEAV